MIDSGKHAHSIGRNLDTVASNEGAIGRVPDVPSEVAILLALVVLELTTNALKYGTLSSSGGRISLAWRKSDKTLYAEWVERGGPKPNKCSEHGFGTKLLQASVRRFNGSVDMKFEPNGLRVGFSLNLPTDSPLGPPDVAEEMDIATEA